MHPSANMSEVKSRFFVEGPAVVVPARVAAALAGFLLRYEREWREFAAPYAGVELASVRMALEDAARIATPGNRLLPESETGTQSLSMGEDTVTTDEAASRLGVGSRRVRQLLASGELTGRLVAGRWMVDAAAVEERL